jgi:hypothetical protein
LFGRLSVFAGGWTLEASEAVGSGEGVEEREVLDLLSGLVEKSLVVARGNDEGGVRYRLLEPVRQYALERLEESGEAEAAQRAHALYFLDLSEEAEPELLGPREAKWYDRLEEEHDNIRAALSWSLEGADPDLGLRLAGAIWWFWHRHGHLREGLRWLEGALAKEGGASATARVKALGGIGWLAFGLGDQELMRDSATEGLRLSDEAGLGGNHRAHFLNVLADASWLEGDHSAQRRWQQRAWRSAAKQTTWGVWRTHSSAWGPPRCGDRGDLEPGQGFLQRRPGHLATVRQRVYSPLMLEQLGSCVLAPEGTLSGQAALAEEAAALSKEAGDMTLLPFPLNNLGWVALLRGDLGRAKALHKESLALSKELGSHKQLTVTLLEGLACGAGAEGDAERAARLFGATEALREATGFPLEPALRGLEGPYLVGARSQLERARGPRHGRRGGGCPWKRPSSTPSRKESPPRLPLPRPRPCNRRLPRPSIRPGSHLGR